MNFKTITISSLLLCTARALNDGESTTQPDPANGGAAPAPKADPKVLAGADKLAAAIAATYKNAEGNSTLEYSKLSKENMELVKELRHDFHFDDFINDNGHESKSNPKSKDNHGFKFCGVVESKENFPMIVALREKHAPSKEHLDKLNSIVDPKIKYVMDKLSHLPFGTAEKIRKELNIEKGSELDTFIEAQFEAFEAVLREYEPKPKNFKGLRNMMEALHVVTRFESKAIVALDYLVEHIKKADGSIMKTKAKNEDAKTALNNAYTRVAEVKDASQKEKDDAAAKLNEAYENYKKTMAAFAKASLIRAALQTAKDKTSSAITLAWFLGVFVLVAMGMLVVKQFQLKKLKQEEEPESD